jgi:hypothetical protein
MDLTWASWGEPITPFMYTDTLPMVGTLKREGYVDVLQHLLLTGKKYGGGNLGARPVRLR